MSDHKMVQADSTEIFLLERLNSLNYAVKENYESVLRMFLTVKNFFKAVFSLLKPNVIMVELSMEMNVRISLHTFTKFLVSTTIFKRARHKTDTIGFS